MKGVVKGCWREGLPKVCYEKGSPDDLPSVGDVQDSLDVEY